MIKNKKYVIEVDSDKHDNVVISVFAENKTIFLRKIVGKEALNLYKILKGEV